jgi:hypothetical protein
MTRKLNEVINNVSGVLSESEHARNSDKYLIWLYLTKHHGLNTSFAEFESAPSFESITRCRRKLNQRGLFLPTIEVKNRRSARIEEFREFAKDQW